MRHAMHQEVAALSLVAPDGMNCGQPRGALPKDRLSLAVRQWSEQVYLRVRDQIDHGLQIGLESGNGRIPCGSVRRSITVGPVAVRKFWGRRDPGQR